MGKRILTTREAYALACEPNVLTVFLTARQCREIARNNTIIVDTNSLTRVILCPEQIEV